MKKPMVIRSVLAFGFSVGVMANAFGKDKPSDLDPLFFEYSMPTVAYKIQVSLPIEACEPNFVLGEPTAVAMPEMGADNTIYKLKLSALEKKRIDSNVTIAKYDNGTIKSINAVADDRTFGIVGNIFKFVASLFKGVFHSFDGSAFANSFGCSQPTKDLFSEAKAIKAANERDLKALTRIQLNPQDPKAAGSLATSTEKIIAMRGQRLAAVQEALAVKGECTLKSLRSTASAECAVELEMSKRLMQDNALPAPDISLTFKVDRGNSALKDMANEQSSLALRIPNRTKLQMTSTSPLWKIAIEDLPELTIPQWGHDVALPLTVGISQKRTMALTLSPVGDITSINWATPARLERATADLAGAAEAAAATRTAIRYGADDAEIAALDKEIALLEKRAKLEELKAKKASTEPAN